jgi:predicted nuclease of predicted toxin-antitoxin system
MKLLVDNNLSFKLVQPLQDLFTGTQHVGNTLSITTDDISIWNYAKINGFIILTKDNDFDERSQLEGCPPKIIHLICGNKTTLHILNLLLWRKEELLLFGESDTENCILKVS